MDGRQSQVAANNGIDKPAGLARLAMSNGVTANDSHLDGNEAACVRAENVLGLVGLATFAECKRTTGLAANRSGNDRREAQSLDPLDHLAGCEAPLEPKAIDPYTGSASRLDQRANHHRCSHRGSDRCHCQGHPNARAQNVNGRDADEPRRPGSRFAPADPRLQVGMLAVVGHVMEVDRDLPSLVEQDLREVDHQLFVDSSGQLPYLIHLGQTVEMVPQRIVVCHRHRLTRPEQAGSRRSCIDQHARKHRRRRAPAVHFSAHHGNHPLLDRRSPTLGQRRTIRLKPDLHAVPPLMREIEEVHHVRSGSLCQMPMLTIGHSAPTLAPFTEWCRPCRELLILSWDDHETLEL